VSWVVSTGAVNWVTLLSLIVFAQRFRWSDHKNYQSAGVQIKFTFFCWAKTIRNSA